MPDRKPHAGDEASGPAARVTNQWELLHQAMRLVGKTGVFAAGLVVALYFGLKLYYSELREAQQRLQATFTEVASVADRQVASVKSMLETQEAAARAEREANQKRAEAERAATEAEARRSEAQAELARLQADLATKQRELAAATEIQQTSEQQRVASTEQLRKDAELLALAVLGNDEGGKAKEVAATYARLDAARVQQQIDAFVSQPRERASQLARLVGAEVAAIEAALGKAVLPVWVEGNRLPDATDFTIAARAGEHGFENVIELSGKGGRIVAAAAWQHIDAVVVPDPEDASRRRLFFVKLPYAGSGIALETVASSERRSWSLASMLEEAFGTSIVRRQGTTPEVQVSVLDAAPFLDTHKKEFESSFAGNTFDFAAGVRLAERARAWTDPGLPRFVVEPVRSAVRELLGRAVKLAALDELPPADDAQRTLGILGAAALAEGFRIVRADPPQPTANNSVQQSGYRSTATWEVEIEWSSSSSGRRQRLTLLLADEQPPRFVGVAELGRRAQRG